MIKIVSVATVKEEDFVIVFLFLRMLITMLYNERSNNE